VLPDRERRILGPLRVPTREVASEGQEGSSPHHRVQRLRPIGQSEARPLGPICGRSNALTRTARRTAIPLVGVLAIGFLVEVAVSPAEVKGRFAGGLMSGAAVVPGPGDPDGSGEVVIRLIPPRGQGSKWSACVDLTYQGIEEPRRVRVIRGRKGETGPINMSVPVEAIDESFALGCRGHFLSLRLINRIRRHERRYYAEAINAEFPNGAIRGQLRQYTDSGEPKERAPDSERS
jgi:hypothetical protein